MSAFNAWTATLLSLTASLPTHAWQADIIVSGLNVPWGMSAFNDDQVMVTQQNGEIGVVTLSTGNYNAITKLVQSQAHGQGGLLDVAHSPFNKHHFYFTYSKVVGSAIETTLARANYKDGTLSDWTDLVVTQSGSDTGRHFGSRIAFDTHYVYFSVGDRGERDNGQNLATHAGSILRVLPDGTIPPDNPFTNVKGARGEIWSYGHRNPQGLYYDRQSTTLWSIEHGPRGGDEINQIVKGANYGWPVTSHGKEYWGPVAVGEATEKEGIVSPTKVYIPSIAPSSLLLYRGSKYPQLSGKLLAGALKLTHINVVKIDKNQAMEEERILTELGERIRDIEALPNGEIIFSTDSGKIYRLVDEQN